MSLLLRFPSATLLVRNADILSGRVHQHINFCGSCYARSFCTTSTQHQRAQQKKTKASKSDQKSAGGGGGGAGGGGSKSSLNSVSGDAMVDLKFNTAPVLFIKKYKRVIDTQDLVFKVSLLEKCLFLDFKEPYLSF